MKYLPRIVLFLIASCICVLFLSTSETLSVHISDKESHILYLTNEYRRANNLAILKLDEGLTKSAREKAHDLCDNQYWSHDRPDGEPFYKVIMKYNSARSVGENLAKGSDDTAVIMEAWKKSPLHNANILTSRWKYVGIGHVKCQTGVDYYVSHFKSL